MPMANLLVVDEALAAPPSPSDDPLQLHARVLTGQPGALDCLANVFLKALPPRLERTFRQVPWDFAIDAATDACLDYAAHPERFDSSRTASIVDFVFLIARRNLVDRLRGETALKNREARYGRENALIPPPKADRGRSGISLWAAISAVTIDSSERRAAKLWLDDIGNDAIAQALGVDQLDATERRRHVKRFKDRLIKRLSRHFRPVST
jgi:hypothetical protein